MKKTFFVLIALLTPTFAMGAQTNLDKLLGQTIPKWLDYLIAIAFTLALFWFVWGIATFIMKSGDSSAKEEGKNKMLWGIAALFIITAIWGIVNFIEVSIFGGRSINEVDTPALPGENTNTGGGNTGGGNTGGGGSGQQQLII